MYVKESPNEAADLMVTSADTQSFQDAVGKPFISNIKSNSFCIYISKLICSHAFQAIIGSPKPISEVQLQNTSYIHSY